MTKDTTAVATLESKELYMQISAMLTQGTLQGVERQKIYEQLQISAINEIMDESLEEFFRLLMCYPKEAPNANNKEESKFRVISRLTAMYKKYCSSNDDNNRNFYQPVQGGKTNGAKVARPEFLAWIPVAAEELARPKAVELVDSIDDRAAAAARIDPCEVINTD